MDWLTSLLQGGGGAGDPGAFPQGGYLPTAPQNPQSPFDPIPGVAALNNQPPANPQVTPAAGASKDNALITALRGVASPPKPDVLKPSTPAQPHQGRAIKSGALLDLLNQVSNPRVARPAATTLGGALGIGRY